jgi:hypothetical protein
MKAHQQKSINTVSNGLLSPAFKNEERTEKLLTLGAGIWTSGQSGGLARRRSRFNPRQGRSLYIKNLTEIYERQTFDFDVYPQRREHSWDGYVRYTKVLISQCFFFLFFPLIGLDFLTQLYVRTLYAVLYSLTYPPAPPTTPHNIPSPVWCA